MDMSMETVRIEGIATPVSRIGLGTWAIGGWMWGGTDEARSVATLLSGRMGLKTAFDGDDLRKSDPKFQPPRVHQYLAAVNALRRFAHETHGKTVLALAVRWILDQGSTIALWGARRPDQLEGIDHALGWKLGAHDLRRIDAMLAEHITNPVGPEFMAPPVRPRILE
jgi:aryl-alcohol dehydrogenase-like predicted oxidoreductase